MKNILYVLADLIVTGVFVLLGDGEYEKKHRFMGGLVRVVIAFSLVIIGGSTVFDTSLFILVRIAGTSAFVIGMFVIFGSIIKGAMSERNDYS